MEILSEVTARMINNYHAAFAMVGIPLSAFNLLVHTLAASPIYAQGMPGDMTVTALIKGVADLGSTFLLGWYLWYTAGKAIPKKDELHAETLKEKQAAYISALKAQQDAYNFSAEQARKDFLDHIKQQRDDYREDIRQVTLAMKEISESITRSHSFHPTPEMIRAQEEAIRKHGS